MSNTNSIAIRRVLRCDCLSGSPEMMGLAKERFDEGLWSDLIILHHRKCRLDVLLAFRALGKVTGVEFWKLLNEVWIDTETIFLNFRTWYHLFTAATPQECSAFMTDEDKAEFAKLPDEFTIYRGYRPDLGNRDGLSWTLDRELAQRFGNRAWTSLTIDKPLTDPRNPGRVAERRVKKREVFAFLTGREEAEVILLPRR